MNKTLNLMLIAAAVATAIAATTFAIIRADDQKPMVVRVLSYNIHHGEGLDGKLELPRIAKVIMQTKADLVAIQEVDDKTKRTGGVDQTAELARLTGMHGKFGKAIDFQGGAYGQVILSRFAIDELKVHMLPNLPEREQRIAVEATVKLGNQAVSFVTTHLDHQLNDLREKQVTELNRLFGSAVHPVILAGDMNALPDSKPVKALAAHWTIATAHPALMTIPAGKPTKQIDYVLYRPAAKFRVVETKVIDEAVASDHRPVLATLELTP